MSTEKIWGQDRAVEQFATAWASRKLHHAWLLAGPKGVGKASFANAAARRVLAEAAGPSFDLPGIETDDDHPIVKLVDAGSHPDMRWLERLTDEKTDKLKRNISVDQVRSLAELFGLSPAMSDWRVAVIDTVDDLETSGANALLKMLEEPPPNTLFFLVSHAPGRLLPTIRSRCRRLAFSTWSEDEAADFVASRAGLDADDARRLAQMAHGAPGRALSLNEEGALEADRSAHDILRQLPNADEAKLLAIADRFRGPEGQARFNLIVERLADQVQTMIHQSAAAGETHGLSRWAEAWSRLSDLPGEAEAINLDRADAFFSVIGELRAAARA